MVYDSLTLCSRSAAARRPLHLRSCPTVFFRHVCLITLSLPQGKFDMCFENITSCCFLHFKACLTWNLLPQSSVCSAHWRHPRGPKLLKILADHSLPSTFHSPICLHLVICISVQWQLASPYLRFSDLLSCAGPHYRALHLHFHLSFLLRRLLLQNCADVMTKISAPIRTGNPELRYLYVWVCS